MKVARHVKAIFHLTTRSQEKKTFANAQTPQFGSCSPTLDSRWFEKTDWKDNEQVDHSKTNQCKWLDTRRRFFN